jgi:CRISPR-associated protein (Cas_CXXC_CXXC).
VARLPDSHSSLQERMDEFLNVNGLDVTTSGLLVDGPYAVKPKIKIQIAPDSKKHKGHCYLCGQPSDVLEEATQTTFPLITGASGVRSFNSMGQNPEKVCWKCSFLGKFVPVNGFYYSNGENVFAFFPYSTSLGKMLDVFTPLREAETLDPNYYYNFDHGIGGFFHHGFEIAFAFLYTLYRKVFMQEKGQDDQPVLDWDKFYQLIIDKAVLEFFVLHAKKEGSTFSVKTLWPFRETDYFYRLLYRVEQAGVDVKEFLRLLVDFNQKNENTTLIRNRICERILKKSSILDLAESFAYRAEKNYIKPVVDFLLVYEEEIRRGDSVKTFRSTV